MTRKLTGLGLDRADCYNRTEVKARGWTDALIRRFLGEPDATRENPRYKSAAPVRLYLRDRVEATEATAEFRAAVATGSNRRAGARKAIETKMERLRAELAAVRIEVPALDRGVLFRRACAHYNRRREDRAIERGEELEGSMATEDSDPAFLERIAVNYLRHRLTSYDARLEEIAGKVGARDGRGEIARRVFLAIEEAYPWLALECRRQLDARGLDPGDQAEAERDGAA